VRFAAADVTRLPATAAGVALADATFDAVHCLEVAFPLRRRRPRRLPAESYRVLRPGGRWCGELRLARRAPGGDRAPRSQALVRDTWCFTEFEPLERYRARAAALGFRERRASRLDRARDQTRFQKIAQTNARIGTFRLGRLILRTFRPRLTPHERRRLDSWSS